MQPHSGHGGSFLSLTVRSIVRLGGHTARFESGPWSNDCYHHRMARTKKPKVQIKRQKVSMVYRIYIDGMYMGTGLTQASTREAAPRMLAITSRPMTAT